MADTDILQDISNDVRKDDAVAKTFSRRNKHPTTATVSLVWCALRYKHNGSDLFDNQLVFPL